MIKKQVELALKNQKKEKKQIKKKMKMKKMMNLKKFKKLITQIINKMQIKQIQIKII